MPVIEIRSTIGIRAAGKHGPFLPACRDISSIAQYSGLSRESNALNLLVQSSLRRICESAVFLRFTGERAELRRRNAALGSRLIGGSDLQDYVFFAGLGPKHEREGKSRQIG